eukprot:s2277_g2.t1
MCGYMQGGKSTTCQHLVCPFCLWLLCGERALPPALAAVAVPGADTARVATALFGAGLAHIGPGGGRPVHGAPLQAANPGPTVEGKGAATHREATTNDNGLVVQRDRAVEALAQAGLPQCSLPPFPPLPFPAVEAREQVADTISDTDSRVSELLAYLTPRAADGTGTLLGEGCVAKYAGARSTAAGAAPSSATSGATSHGTSAANQLLALHATLAGWRRPPQPARMRTHGPHWFYNPRGLRTRAGHRPIAAAIWSAAEVDADPGATTEDCTHACTCVGAQPTARLTLRQAVHAAAGADGYLTAATQSAFLQLFGGVTLAAEAAALADRARACLQTAAPRAPFIGGVAVQQDVLRRRAMRSAKGGSPRAASCAKARTALGAPWLVSKGAAGCEPALDHVLALLFQKKNEFSKAL